MNEKRGLLVKRTIMMLVGILFISIKEDFCGVCHRDLPDVPAGLVRHSGQILTPEKGGAGYG